MTPSSRRMRVPEAFRLRTELSVRTLCRLIGTGFQWRCITGRMRATSEEFAITELLHGPGRFDALPIASSILPLSSLPPGEA